MHHFTSALHFVNKQRVGKTLAGIVTRVKESKTFLAGPTFSGFVFASLLTLGYLNGFFGFSLPVECVSVKGRLWKRHLISRRLVCSPASALSPPRRVERAWGHAALCCSRSAFPINKSRAVRVSYAVENLTRLPQPPDTWNI